MASGKLSEPREVVRNFIEKVISFPQTSILGADSGDDAYARFLPFVNILHGGASPYTTKTMATGAYEGEIKSLLGSADAANALKERLKAYDPSCVLHASSAQLNHYFEGGDPKALAKRMEPHVSNDANRQLKNIVENGKKISVR